MRKIKTKSIEEQDSLVIESIVAVDPGLEYTGIARFDGKFAYCKTVHPLKETYGFEKILSMSRRICSCIEDGDMVVFEDYGFGGKFFNALIPELMALIKNELFYRKENIMMMVAPNTIKKVVVGNGRATKSQVRKAVKKIADRDDVIFTTNHESDAYALMNVFMRFQAQALDEKMTRALSAKITDWRRR